MNMVHCSNCLCEMYLVSDKTQKDSLLLMSATSTSLSDSLLCFTTSGMFVFSTHAVTRTYDQLYSSIYAIACHTYQLSILCMCMSVNNY